MSRPRNESFKSTPYIEEAQFGDSIGLRSECLPEFKDIGPPDLVHVSKYSKSTQKENGSFHHVIGLDLSSTAAPIAYLTTLSITDSLKSPKVGTYCSYNCFSKCDLRIRIQDNNDTSFQIIPNDRKKKILSFSDENKIDVNFWQETYVSCLVRAALISDDISRQMIGLCQFNPIVTTSSARLAILSMIKLLNRGGSVGCNVLVQSPNNLQNYLVDSLLKMVELTELYEFAIDSIQSLYPKGDFDLVVVKMLLLSNNELKAVQKMHSALKKNPRNGLILNEQAKFLIIKKRPDLALIPAMKAVEVLPAEFDCWATLFKVHLLKNDVKSAILCINSFPMYNSRSVDRLKDSSHRATYFPKPNDGIILKIWDYIDAVGPVVGDINSIKLASTAEVDAVDPILLRLNGNNLNGTFKEAYKLLSLFVRLVGWDNLLQIRSSIFVMEEEYRSKSSVDLHDEDKFKRKRLCERWLDSLFLVLYDDLRCVTLVESNTNVKHSALEWELVGYASMRVHHFSSAVSAIRTTLNARYNYLAAMQFLSIYNLYSNDELLSIYTNYEKQLGNLELNLVLDVLVKTISWQYRWYGEFQPFCFLILKKLVKQHSGLLIRSKIQVLFGNEGIVGVMERMVNWCENFSDE